MNVAPVRLSGVSCDLSIHHWCAEGLLTALSVNIGSCIRGVGAVTLLHNPWAPDRIPGRIAGRFKGPPPQLLVSVLDRWEEILPGPSEFLMRDRRIQDHLWPREQSR